ncbi:MAG: hypothetical protein RSA29_13570 [Clostridium sp.]|uniref:hypothetical protein n=1 Tax=Clostridium sp. TaxID=1506 RepID=UPI00306E2B0A
MEKIKNVYKYGVYGLNIESEIYIPQFINNEFNDEVDIITIKYGIVPTEVKKNIDSGRHMKVTSKEVWLDVENIAIFYITNGAEIIVEPCRNADINDINIYLMCSCLGFIMLQRGKIALHGGAVVINNNGVIIAGDRGAGKSTLTTALRNKGYKFITDDVSAIHINKAPYIEYGFPYQKLCEDSMLSFNCEKLKEMAFKSGDKIKYMVPVYEQFLMEQTPLTNIFEIIVGDVKEVMIEEFYGEKKLQKISNNVYRGEYIRDMGNISTKYFKQCIEIAKNSRYFQITRPKQGFTVNEQIELIEKEILKENIA